MTRLPSVTPIEIELKLLLTCPAARVAAYLTELGEEQAPLDQRTVYYDTAEMRLAARDISLRVRHFGEGPKVQTLKRPKAASSFGEREELETPTAADVPDFQLFDMAGWYGVQELAGLDLRALFTTKLRRRRWLLNQAGSQIEAVIDQGEIVAGDRRLPLLEVELELKRGDRKPMLDLALALVGEGFGRIGAESKSARGYRLINPALIRAHKADKIALAADMRMTDVFRLLVADAVHQLLANMPAVEMGIGPGLHQMRVALRRLRSFFVLFKPLLTRKAEHDFDMPLRDYGAILGKARDWDVFIEHTLKLAEHDLPTQQLSAALLPIADQRRKDAWRGARDLLRSRRLSETLLQITRWSENPQDHFGASGGGDLGDHIDTLVDPLLRRVEKQAEAAQSHDPREGWNHPTQQEALHSFRKALKKLRYSLDALSGLMHGKGLKRYSKRLERLLDLLGLINDTAVTDRLIVECLSGASLSTATAVATIRRWNEERRLEALASLPAAWSDFTEAKPSWHQWD